jgi:hypothetical protein
MPARLLLPVEKLEVETLGAEGLRKERGEAGDLNLEQGDQKRFRKTS